MREVVIKKLIPNLSKRAAKRWARFTEESNERFQKLSLSRKRVAIAEDVIAQMKARALVATHGQYVESDNLPEDVDALRGVDLAVAIPYFETCNVCAVGSVMICTIMRDDKKEFSSDVSFGGNEAYQEAERFFTNTQLSGMEHVFESWSTLDCSGEDWFPMDLNAKQILTLIMEHVIAAKGSFTICAFKKWLKTRCITKRRRTTKARA